MGTPAAAARSWRELSSPPAERAVLCRQLGEPFRRRHCAVFAEESWSVGTLAAAGGTIALLQRRLDDEQRVRPFTVRSAVSLAELPFEKTERKPPCTTNRKSKRNGSRDASGADSPRRPARAHIGVQA